jgi:hypothetical protein
VIAAKQSSNLKTGRSGERKTCPNQVRKRSPNANFMPVTATQQGMQAATASRAIDATGYGATIMSLCFCLSEKTKSQQPID